MLEFPIFFSYFRMFMLTLVPPFCRFHPSAKTKQEQTAKNTAPMAAAPLRQNTNASLPSSSKPDRSTIRKRTSTLLPAASRAPDAALAVRPHLEPKQVVLTLPVVHFKPLRFHSRGGNPNPKEPPSAVSPPQKR